jgi:hypothetical protein
VDRAALDFAIAHSIPHGGWCPKYRIAQDGTVPLKYQLQEAEKPGYPYRTKLNVRDSDGTVVFTTDPPGRGSAMTLQSCIDFGRSYLLTTDHESLEGAAARLLEFLRKYGIKTLNVAGSRKPSLYQFAMMVLQTALFTEEPVSARLSACAPGCPCVRQARRRKAIPDDFGEGDRKDN